MEILKNTVLKFANKEHGRCICLDPGVTTGVSVFHFKNNEFTGITNMQFTGYSWLPELELNKECDFLVVERLFIPKKTGFYDGGIKVCGAVEMYCEQHKINYKYQEPSVPKFIEGRYKKYLDDVKFPIHCREAMYHGIMYLRDHMEITVILNTIRKQKNLKPI